MNEPSTITPADGGPITINYREARLADTLSDLSMNECYVISDLHMFSRRSRAADQMEQIRKTVSSATTLVLAGDIVDFKWSEIGEPKETAEAASEWLEKLLQASTDCELHYLLGNHDHHPALIERLKGLAACHPRFHWQPFHLRLGNAVFLHGDAAIPRMNSERLKTYRERFGEHRRRGPVMNRLYDAVVAARIHVMGAQMLYPDRTVLRRLFKYLDEIECSPVQGVRNIYFGHTHRALADAEYGGLKFHNCGAPMPGLNFGIIRTDLT
jgi:hypothetical protein